MARKIVQLILCLKFIYNFHLSSCDTNITCDVNKDENGDHKNMRDTTLFKSSDEATTENVNSNDYDEIVCVNDPVLCNMTKEEYVEKLHEYVYPTSYERLLIIIYILVFVSGLIGNGLVCITIYRNKSMRNVVNYFLLNLAMADFLVILLCLPPIILSAVSQAWFIGTTFCRILLYLQSVSVTVSVITLTAISLHRWYAICNVFKFNPRTVQTKFVILITWLVSLTINIPEVFLLNVKTEVYLNHQFFMQCTYTREDDNELIFHFIKATILYIVPLTIIAIAYYGILKVILKSGIVTENIELHDLHSREDRKSRRQMSSSNNEQVFGDRRLKSRRKATAMLFVVVVIFAVCFFPIHFLYILRALMWSKENQDMTVFKLIANILCYVHSTVNPYIYGFMSGLNAVKIVKVSVPEIIQYGVQDAVILDCDYTYGNNTSGLVVKWFFKNKARPVYQWIATQKPQDIGILRGRVDLTYRASEDPLKMHRALRIVKLNTDISGNYTCVVSTFMEEDSRTRRMIVFVPETNFRLIQNKTDDDTVNVICAADGAFPAPNLTLATPERQLDGVSHSLKLVNGRYSAIASVTLQDADLPTPAEFICTLRIPHANYAVRKEAIYYPGPRSTTPELPTAPDMQLAAAVGSKGASYYAAVSVVLLSFAQL